MISMQHQDWNTVVLNPSRIVKTVDKNSGGAGGSKVGAAMSGATGTPAWKVEQRVDSEVGKPVDYVPREIGQAIVAGRVAMKLSQKDLATRVCMPLQDIQGIENGKAVYNREKVAKIKKFLRI